MEELYRMMQRYSKLIRESLGDDRFAYGEIYADTVFGAMLSAVKDEEIKKALINKAFEENRSKNAMCVSLEREEIAANAMKLAGEKGIPEAICTLLGVSEKYLQIIENYMSEFISRL